MLDFFETHFTVTQGPGDASRAVANIRITTGLASDAIEEMVESGEDFYIRKSASPFFTIPSKRLSKGDTDYFYCEHVRTLLAMDAREKHIRVVTDEHAANEAFDLLLIELIRDLVIKHEEQNGVIVVHASCAYKNGQALLITGPKGSGKTTTIMELVHRFDYQLMSGDKAFLFEQAGRLMVSGWPDYPHIGLGTLTKYPALALKANVRENTGDLHDLWSPAHKVAVDPRLFREMLPPAPAGLACPISCIVFPNISESTVCEVRSVTNGGERIAGNIETVVGGISWNRFNDDHAWNPTAALRRVQLLLERLDAFEIKGSGVLPEELAFTTNVNGGLYVRSTTNG